MGGIGSGSYPGNPNQRGGRQKADVVRGSGEPEKPVDMPASVSVFWDMIVERTSGSSFVQDSEAIAELAWLSWRQSEMRKSLEETPLDIELNKQSLAIGRALMVLWDQFGLTPRARQKLIVPKQTESEVDELDKLMSG